MIQSFSHMATTPTVLFTSLQCGFSSRFCLWAPSFSTVSVPLESVTISFIQMPPRFFFPALTSPRALDFFKTRLIVFVWLYLCILHSILFIYTSVLPLIPHCLDYCSFIMSFEIRWHESSNLFLFFKIVLAIFLCLSIYILESVRPHLWKYLLGFLLGLHWIFK